MNALLFVVALYLSDHIVFQSQAGIKFTLPPVRKTVEEKRVELAQNSVASLSDFAVIGEQNLFHPTRTIPVEKPPAPPLPTPDFVLYGTLITEDFSLAYIADKKSPINSPTRGVKQLTLRKGEMLSGFLLTDVKPDMIVMKRNEEIINVPLDSPKVRETVAAAAAAQPPPTTAQSVVVPPPVRSSVVTSPIGGRIRTHRSEQ